MNPCLSHAYPMHIPCPFHAYLVMPNSYLFYVHFMPISYISCAIPCLFHAYLMPISCLSCAYLIPIPCLSHAYPMSIPCLSHVYSMPIPCLSHVYSMPILGLSGLLLLAAFLKLLQMIWETVRDLVNQECVAVLLHGIK